MKVLSNFCTLLGRARYSFVKINDSTESEDFSWYFLILMDTLSPLFNTSDFIRSQK